MIKLNHETPKPYRVLLDGDVLTELLYYRGSFAEDIELLLGSLAKNKNSDFYITDKAIRQLEAEHSDPLVSEEAAIYFRELFGNNILAVTNSIIQEARQLNFPDFDSAIEHVCAQEYGLTGIITLNQANFPNATIQIWPISILEKMIKLEQHLEPDFSCGQLLLRYTDYGLFMEYVTASLDSFTAQQVMLAVQNGDKLHLETGQAAFLLPANLPGINQLRSALQEDATDAISLTNIDEEYVEVRLKGTWMAKDIKSESGTFMAALSPEREELLYRMWQVTQSSTGYYM